MLYSYYYKSTIANNNLRHLTHEHLIQKWAEQSICSTIDNQTADNIYHYRHTYIIIYITERHKSNDCVCHTIIRSGW